MSRSASRTLFYVKRGNERVNGYLPLMCRLMMDGETKWSGYKLDVPPKLQDVKTARAMGRNAEAQKINATIDRIHMDVNCRYQKLTQPGGYVTVARLRNTYFGLGMKCETLLKLLEQHSEKFTKKVEHSRVQGTYNRYRTMYRHLCELVPKVYRHDDIPLKELNLTFINNFGHFLHTEKKYHINTVWGYMIRLKHAIPITRNSDALPFNPFAGRINSPKSVDRGYLTKREIQTLAETPVKSGTYELIRNLLIFSMFTRLACADVKALITNRFQTFSDSDLWVITRRHKTNTESNIHLLDVPKRIVEKYKGLSKDDHVFPVLSNDKCDTILKELGRRCGFKVRLTCHAARHASVTAVLLSYGVPIETVSYLLGHTDLKATQIYAQITNQKISSDMEILSHKLEEMEKEICDVV